MTTNTRNIILTGVLIVICLVMIAFTGCVGTTDSGTKPLVQINLGDETTATPTPVTLYRDTVVSTPSPRTILTSSPTPAPVSTYTTPKRAVMDITKTAPSSWEMYVNNKDGLTMYHPEGWEITEMPKSDITTDTMILPEFVFMYSPSNKGFVLIYGVDTTGTVTALYSSTDNDVISDTLYDSFIIGVKSGFTADNPIKLSRVQTDSGNYVINGNPARKLTLYTTVNGESLNGDFYLIAKGNRYYIEGFMGMAGSSDYESTTATDIMRTLSIH
jgi:hypothetical protein